MNENELRQFKTTSGEEVVCEVVQWNEGYDTEVLVRKAMRLVLIETEDGIKYYSFRPWMVYQEHPDDLIILNINNVIGIGFPPDTLLSQYNEAVAEMAEMNTAREEEFNQSFSQKAARYKNKRTSNHDKIDDYLSRMDSGSNVIDMFDPSKIH